MRRFITMLTSCFLLSIAAFCQPVDSNFHLYILAGQSNMAGRGEITDAYRIQEHPGVFMLTKDLKWVKAKHPLHFDKPVAGIGPGLSFGIKMAEANAKVKIGLVPCAVGGTSINAWAPGAYDNATKTHPYDDALVRIQAAMQKGIVKGIIWLQGESDSDPAKASTYLDKLTTLIQRLRAVTENNSLPFVAGELGRFRPVFANINTVLAKLPSLVPNTGVVRSEGLNHKGDTTHFDAPSATILGARFAAAMLQLQSSPAPLAGAAGGPVRQSLNTGWLFHKGDLPVAAADGRVTWEEVNLPHSWNATDVMDDVPGYYRGAGWYKRTVYLPVSYQNKELYLYFEGANQVADVYVNNHKVGSHTGGYTAFSFPISKYLEFSSETTANEIMVRVDNSHSEDIPPLSADFSFYGGIYRDVYLVGASPVHFDLDDNASTGIFITTPHVSAAKADVVVRGALVNNTGGKKSLRVLTKILDDKGIVVASKEAGMTVGAGERLNFIHQLNGINQPKLWSPEEPALYRVVSTITDAKTKELLDVVTNPLGFRWFRFDPNEGFFLNDKPYKLIGASRHQDFKDLANALPDAFHVRDVQLLKDMGANFLRVAHYPQDPAVLQACDRLGILASVEIPIVNQITESEAFRRNCLDMQREMIRQNFNHPSVIIWAYMNEVLLRPRFSGDTVRQKLYYQHVVDLASQIEALTRKEDPARYTMIPNHGSYGIYTRVGLTKVPMLVGWNKYDGWYSGKIEDFPAFLDMLHREVPDKPVIITEYGSDADSRLHSLDPVRFDKSIEYTTGFHKAYLQAIMERPFVASGMLWNLAEFNAEQRAETTPHVNAKGVLTWDRQPKDAYLFYQANLLRQPFLRIGSRTWAVRSGNAVSEERLVCVQPVTVFSNLEAVELQVNGITLGVVKTDRGIATFNVPFNDGVNTLKAFGRKGDSTYTDVMTVPFILQPHDLRSSALPFKAINVSLGDQRHFIDDAGQPWVPEQEYKPGSWGYVGGTVYKAKGATRLLYGTDKNILGTDLDPVYATQRTGISQFRLEVPAGYYEVTLHFAELQSNKEREALIYNLDTTITKETAAERVFDIWINNAEVMHHLGSRTYLVPEKAYAFKTFVTVADAGLQVNLIPVNGETILNGIQVRRIY